MNWNEPDEIVKMMAIALAGIVMAFLAVPIAWMWLM
jgi:hypothetical protein